MKNLIYLLKKSLIPATLILCYATFGNECPEGSSVNSFKLTHPQTKEIIHFNCLNDTRREFIQFSPEKNEKLVATVHNHLNESTGEVETVLNLLTKLIDNETIFVEKYGVGGNLERYERYENHKIIQKFIERAQRLEEFSYEGSDEAKIIRSCFYNSDSATINEMINSDVMIEFSMSIREATAETLLTSHKVKLIKEKIELEINTINGAEYELSKYNTQYCIRHSFLPKHIKGEVKYKSKRYIIQEAELDFKNLRDLFANNKSEQINALLAEASSEVHEIPIEAEIEPTDENVTPEEPNTGTEENTNTNSGEVINTDSGNLPSSGGDETTNTPPSATEGSN